MPKLPNRKRDVPVNGKAPLRSSLADAAWAVEDRVVLGASDLFHGLVEAVRWPVERVSWAVEHWLVWPIQEEAAGWSRPVRAGAVAAVVLVAAVGIAAGIAVSNPSGGERGGTLASAPEPVAATPTPDPQAQVQAAEAAAGPVLNGAEPEFAEESGGGIPEAARDEAAAQAKANEGVAAVSPEKSASAEGGSVVAGPEAIDVARQFAGAFVLYETGRTDADVRKAFAATASPELKQALLKRPPRLPAGVDVPKAKVLNIVSGPKTGDAYTLSVSLLRVGVTSELKLEMEKLPGGMQGDGGAKGATVQWQVTDVRG
ncbi:MAG TPA: hypothetical protein VIT85_08695 [Solirubrobacterales bacterium]